MTRNELVVLISRSLSVSFGATALVEITYLPERLFSYVHNTGGVKAVDYFTILYRLEVASLFVRIVIYLLLAFVFWKCGPWVERTLLPLVMKQDQST